ncbi:hypothetical protein NB689_001926 [Xanthomonas sacchari]|nr:hypothetical protein [Xanthomonas sacchari]
MLLGQEGVDPDQRQTAVVLLVFVVQALFLDLAALVHGVHRAEHATALADRLELLVHRFFHQVGELLDDEAALPGVLAEVQPQLLVDDHLDRHRAAHAFLGRRGDRLVVGVGVQAVAVVEQRVQRLQRGADVVELDLLRVQRTARGLDVVLHHLAALVAAVALAHRPCPDPPRHAADHRVLRVHAVAEEEAQVRREIVDVHAARQVVLDDGEAVAEGEGELADRVRPGLGDVIAGDRHRVEVAHLLLDEILLNVAHHAQRELGAEDAGVLRLVLLEDVGLHRAAHAGQGLRLDLRVGLRVQQLVAADPEQGQAEAVVARRQRAVITRAFAAFEQSGQGLLGLGPALRIGLEMFLHLLVDGGVHEHRQDHRRRTVDGHRHAGGRRAQVEAGVQLLHVVQGRDVDSGVADLAVDVRARRRVLAVQGDAVEGRGQACGRLADAQVVEAPVGALGRALAGEHADRILAGAPVRIHAAGVRIAAGQVLLAEEGQQFAPALVARRGDLRNGLVAQRLPVVLHPDRLAAHRVFGDRVGDRLQPLRPLAQQLQRLAGQRLQGIVVALAQEQQAGVDGVGGRIGGCTRRRQQILRRIQFQLRRQLRVLQFVQRLPERLRAVGGLGLAQHAGIEGAPLLGDLGQVAHACAGNQHGGARLLQRGVELRAEIAVRRRASGGIGLRRQLVAQQATQIDEHPAHTRVVELAGDGRIHRHRLVLQLERRAVAPPLLAHVAQRVLGAAPVVLVQHHQFREVEHVDLLQLARRTVVAGHHVHREIHQIDDLRIALADTGGLHDHQVVADRLQQRDAVLQHPVGSGVLAPRGHRTHVHARAAQRVHADAVAEQRAAGAAPARVDRDHRDAHLREAGQEAVEQFVGDRGLAGTAGAGQAEYGRGAPTARLRCGRRAGLQLLAQQRQFRLRERAVLDRRQHPADADLVVDVRQRGAGRRRATRLRRGLAPFPGTRHHVLDHLHKAHLHAVVGVVDALHAVGLQFGDLLRRDGAATATEYAHMAGAALAQHVDHVLEVLHVAALVGRQRDRVGVLVQRRAHHVLDAAVVAEMDHLGALRLDQAAHDVDRRIVAVEQAGGGDETQGTGVRLRQRNAGRGKAHRADIEKRMPRF